MIKNKTCLLLEQYLNYLSVMKGRSPCTIREYRADILMFFLWLSSSRGNSLVKRDFKFVDINYINSITLNDMYAFISYYQNERNASAGAQSRRIVAIRQFWKYLKDNDLIESNIAERLETFKQPKRLPRYLSLEESVRLLIACSENPRDHCIMTILLNCALRISELANLNISQISCDVLSIIGKGNKERKVFLTPAAKRSVARWMEVRSLLDVQTDALFISRNKQRMSIRSLQDVVKKYVELAGLDPKLISPHKLRHTSATLMYKYGKVDIRSLQQILGHESVATTEIYTHVDESQLQAAVNSNPLAIMFNS